MSIDFSFPFQGLMTRIQAQMLTAQTVATDGEWVDFAHVNTFSIDVENLSGADVVQIRVSNRIDKPGNSFHGRQLGRDITENRVVSSSTHRFRWVKVRKETGGGSATDAWLFADWRLVNR